MYTKDDLRKKNRYLALHNRLGDLDKNRDKWDAELRKMDNHEIRELIDGANMTLSVFSVKESSFMVDYLKPVSNVRLPRIIEDFQNKYPSREEKELALSQMDDAEIQKMIDAVPNIYAKIFYSQFLKNKNSII